MARSRQSVRRSVAAVAVSAAGSVRLLAALIRSVSGKAVRDHPPPIPPLEAWLPLYRRSRRVAAAWRGAIHLAPTSPLVAACAAGADEVAIPLTHTETAKLVAELGDSLVFGPGTDAILASAEGQFVIRVTLPCVVLHRRSPAVLLREARMGSDEALELLLRLDKSVVADPVVARRWHHAINDPRRSRRDRFAAAMAGRPRVKITRATLRSWLGGLVSQIASESGSPSTAPQIRAMFSAVARDGWLPDEVMPAGEALTKAIERNRNWPLRRAAQKPRH